MPYGSAGSDRKKYLLVVTITQIFYAIVSSLILYRAAGRVQA